MSTDSSKISRGEVEEHAQERAQIVIAEKPKRKWQSYIWDTFDKSPEERKFLFKIDTALLTLASLGMSVNHCQHAILIELRILHQVFGSSQHQ